MTEIEEKVMGKLPRMTLLLAIASCLALLLMQIVRWKLVESLTVFIEPFVEIAVGFLFLVMMLASLLFALFRWKKFRTRALIPLALHVVTLLLVLFVPFTMLVVRTDFYLHQSARDAVVRAVATKQLAPHVQTIEALIPLPAPYQSLSSGSQISVTRNGDAYTVLFYTFAGILDNYSGFLYVTDDRQLIGRTYVEKIPLKEHWYWVSSK